MSSPSLSFVIEPSPGHPGWLSFAVDDPAVYNSVVLGPLLVRREGEKACRLRMFPRRSLTNVLGSVHGGATLGLIDVSLFAAMAIVLEGDAEGSVTLDLSTQFIGAGNPDFPLDAVVEVLRETGRLLFLRGVVEQDGTLVAAYNGTVRKPGRKS